MADCYHGTVVKAIRDRVPGAEDVLKSQAIDLTIVTRNCLYLFEVKTSSAPQSIYTAIGQIVAHRPTVSAIAAKKPLVSVIVLPAPPTPRLRDLLVQQLNIRLLLFTRDADGAIGFKDLEGIVTT